MIDFFDKIYISLDNRNQFLFNLRLYHLARFVVRLSANIVLPVYFFFTRRNKAYQLSACQKTDGRYIVSLTSFPARTSRLWLVIETILRQRVKPDMIILWLSKKQYPDDKDIPSSLKRLQERGLKIEIVSEDYRSHKKYYYSLKLYPDDHIITIDDDVFYDTHLIERMIRAHHEHPHSVITNKAHQMTYGKDNKPLEYKRWNYDTHEDKDLFVIGAGGNLYPAHCMDEMVTDISQAMKLTPTGDDIWLNAMVRLKHTKIFHTTYYALEQVPVMNFNNVTLNATNITSSNDIQINALISYLESVHRNNPFIKE